MKKLNILHISAECYPVAKVGGLADVVGALPKYLEQAGAHCAVLMPCYLTKFLETEVFDTVWESYVQLGRHSFGYKILHERSRKLGFDLFMVAIQGLFDRSDVYGYRDDTERFTAFQIASLDWVSQWSEKPDVIHCHDHHTGLIPFMMQFCYKYQSLSKTPSVFTIHNGMYQGMFSWSQAEYIPHYDPWKAGLIDWRGTINPMASAIKCAWKFTTVSESYLQELATGNMNGIEELVRIEWHKALGILNGIDTDVWNPEKDKYLDFTFKANKVKEGKAKNKRKICEAFHLDVNKPLIVFIGRFANEKGADLLPEIFGRSLQEFKRQFTGVVLGNGESSVENSIEILKGYYPGYFNAYIGYNEALAHLLYAGADFLIMPSRTEPCGLNQMYAMKYGTVPIVRSVGGLKDTVIDLGDPGGYGIRFVQANGWDGAYSIYRAIQLYQKEASMDEARRRMMALDFSWERSANKYKMMYRELAK